MFSIGGGVRRGAVAGGVGGLDTTVGAWLDTGGWKLLEFGG